MSVFCSKISLHADGAAVHRLSKDMKIVVPRQELYKILIDVHSQTAHRGRDTKTEDYLKKYHSMLLIQLFVGLCHLHKQQASVTHPTKKPITNPIQVPI